MPYSWGDEPPQVAREAEVSDLATLGPGVEIAKYARVGPGTEVGMATRIQEDAVLRENVKTGRDCLIDYKVIVRPDVEIGDRTRIRSHALVNKGAQIGNDVEIGRDVKIPENTRIGNGVKIEGDWRNPVKIGRDVVIGKDAQVRVGTTIPDGTKIPPRAIVEPDPRTGGIKVTAQVERKPVHAGGDPGFAAPPDRGGNGGPLPETGRGRGVAERTAGGQR